MSEIQLLLGGLSGGFSLGAYVPMILAIFDEDPKRRFIPQRATWFIWFMVTLVIGTTLWIQGARIAAIVPLSYALGSGITAVLSIKHGVGGWEKDDRHCLAISLLGITLWALTKDPFWGLLLNVVADGAGGWPTLKKVWKLPNSEDKAGWILFFFGGFVSLLAVREWNLVNAGYPVFITIFTGALVAMLFLRGRHLRQRQRKEAEFFKAVPV